MSIATTIAWLPSLPIAAAVALAGAVAFVLWIFVDCSFPAVAQVVAQDLRLRFFCDPNLRYWHRWQWYGPRLVLFAILAGISAAASITVFLQLALGPDSERTGLNVVLAIMVLAPWIGLVTLFSRLWWLAFRWRIARFAPAMKKAVAQLSHQWPEGDVFLPGLGNYCVYRDPDHLLRHDPMPLPAFGEAVGNISRQKDCYVRFGIESYVLYLDENVFRRCFVEYRFPGWSPQEVTVTEALSPCPYTQAVRRDNGYRLEDSWHLVFCTVELDVKDEPAPLETGSPGEQSIEGR